MDIATLAILLGVLAAFGVTIWGLFRPKRSAVVGVIATAVAFVFQLLISGELL